MVTFCSPEDARLLPSKLQFDMDTLDSKESIDIMGMVFHYKLSFKHHLEPLT